MWFCAVWLGHPLSSEAQLLSLYYKDPRRDQRNGVIQDEFGNVVPDFKEFAVEVI